MLDLATQLEGIEFLRVHRGLTAEAVDAHLREALTGMLGAGGQPERSASARSRSSRTAPERS